MEYRLTVSVYSDKEHYPVQFGLNIPEELAKLLMATPVTSVSLAVELCTPNIRHTEDKTKLLDFK